MKNNTKETVDIIFDTLGIVKKAYKEEYEVITDLLDEQIKQAILSAEERGKKNRLVYCYEVAQHLRQYARDRFMKIDDKTSGFYEAIKEIERYYGVLEDFFLHDQEQLSNSKTE